MRTARYLRLRWHRLSRLEWVAVVMVGLGIILLAAGWNWFAYGF